MICCMNEVLCCLIRMSRRWLVLITCYKAGAIFCCAFFCFFFLESMQQCVHGSVCLLHIVTLHVVLLLLYISQSANNKCTAFLISRTRRTRPLPGLRSHPGLIELFITNSLGFLRDNHEGYLLLMTSRQTHNTNGRRYTMMLI